MRQNLYGVEYKLYERDRVRTIPVMASNKAEAWELATFEKIPAREKEPPFSAWVKAVVYKSGKVKHFSTFEGKPY